MHPINTTLHKGRRGTQRERLLAGMVAVANRDGYAGASVSTVIAEAGVSRPTFYEYFADKDDCFLAALAEVRGRLLEAVGEAMDDVRSRQVTQAALSALLEFARTHPAMARFLVGEAMAGGPRALDAHDEGIAEVARLIEAAEQRESGATTPDLPTGLLIGAVFRLLASRLRRGVPGSTGLLEDLLDWIASYEQPAGDHRWRAPDPGPQPVRFTPQSQLLAPLALPPGRPRVSEEEVAENHRQRLFSAAARLAAERGYTATTITAITKRARIDRRAFYALFKDKQDTFLAVHEFGFRRVLAVTAGAFFAAGSWPERMWEGGRGFTQFLESNPTIAHVGFVEAYAVGPGAVQRVDDSAMAFAVFLQEGYQQQPRWGTPSRLALEAIVMSIFELVYRQARASATPQIHCTLPLLVFVCLAPFIGPARANDFIDEQLAKPS